ncbi:MAG TPA: hypothetical protein VN047_05850 [Sphingopyxis sp.]|uniref:hypothetical protein n=1 Tax=Sphingopyxis sp. TaxID=1908224 RepID=UPI002BACAB20|nr:hypothetical protein [Sphingopyxis sp.]HWW56395.1 hypothetical protein [Sphingopyxis sp.]
MNDFDRGYRAALADVVELAKIYGEENMKICSDNVLLDPVLRGKVTSPADIQRSGDCSVRSTIHSAQYHASQHLIEAIGKLPRRTA